MKIYNSFNELAASHYSGPVQSQMSAFNRHALGNMAENDGAETMRIDKTIESLKGKIRQIQHETPATEADCIRLESEVEKLEQEIKTLEHDKAELGKRGNTVTDAAISQEPPDDNPIARPKTKPPAKSLRLPTRRKPKDDDDGSWMPPNTRNEEH